MRNLTDSEVLTLQAAGCSAENWQSVYIAENLDVSNIEHCRFEGRVEIEEGGYSPRLYNWQLPHLPGCKGHRHPAT